MLTCLTVCHAHQEGHGAPHEGLPTGLDTSGTGTRSASTDKSVTNVETTPTHPVTDGMHSAIIRALKPAAGPGMSAGQAKAAGRPLPAVT
ncbi:hypothetical protein [Streptomyces sp. NPDC101132]|uniref:hypothetical protein n=1 Tax=Streptomyces sp. NPDC101132 TaxID=3366110 RepID=UPI0037F28D76